MSRLCFLENLTAPALLRLLSGRPERIFVLYRASWAGKRMAVLLHGLGLLPLAEEMTFDFFDDVVVPNGRPALQEAFLHACPDLLKQLEEQVGYKAGVDAAARWTGHHDYLRAYLSKRIFWELVAGVRSILIAQWKARPHLNPTGPSEVLLYREGSWLDAVLQEYAGSFGVRLCRRGLPLTRRIAFRMASLRDRCAQLLYRGRSSVPLSGSAPRVAVEMYHQGIRRCTVYNTDLFWLGHWPMPPHSVFAYFRHAADQPKGERAEILRSAGVGWMDRQQVLRAMAGGASDRERPSRKRVGAPLRAYGIAFYREYERWMSFFTTTGTRIHVSTTDHFPESEALHAALEDTGGLSVSIQRSIEWDARTQRRTALDVHFGFSRANAVSEEQSGSRIRQFIVSGYPFDDVFPAARRFAQGVREHLLQNGMTFVICFLDENEGVNPKTLGGSRATRADYHFLCDRIEEDKTLGLLLKPKRGESLPKRLGPVWGRVERLIQAGRCVLLKGERPDQRYLPCAATTAADVAVNLFDGATAGLESVLAGTRTLLLNRGWNLGPFSALPEGSVVFDRWEEIWTAIGQLRSNPKHPTVGDWDPILEELVSLRDGQSARRIGQYIAWLLEAFRRGMTREEAMGYAGDQYAKAWGPDLMVAAGGSEDVSRLPSLPGH